MDNATLLAVTDFARARTLGTLDAIEKSGLDVPAVLAWRPGPGRAHIAWQAAHCAATHDRYYNVRILNAAPANAELVTHFAGGSTPSDDNVPTIPQIRQWLEATITPLRAFIRAASPAEFSRKLKMPNGDERSVGESLTLLAWHEAHHQGQIHLTLNCFKAKA